jgi:molybdopterin molybdotransferase
VIAFEEACRRISALPPRRRVEKLPLEAAHDRVLATPVIARRSAPETAVSAMDGYAVRDADLAQGPARLRVIGRAFAGDPSDAEVAPGCCVRIFTGAAAPRGADRVILQEEAQADGELVLLPGPPAGRRHLRDAGSDFRAGETLVPAGARLTPQAMVAAAAADLAEVEVYARPRVTILATGDELVEPGRAAATPGAIPDSVSLGIAGLVRAWGGEVVARRRLADRLERLERAAAEAVAGSDMVVVTGGASVGERDHAKAMFEPLGLELIFSKVAIKPGKPVWLGRLGETLVIGLPGNPAAAMTTARLFLAPLLAAAAGGAAEEAWTWRTLPSAAPVGGCADRDVFHRGVAAAGGVRPLTDQDSSSQKSLAAADVLVRRRLGARALNAGDLVETLAF